MQHEPITLIRRHTKVDGPEKLYQVLQTVGADFEWVMGQLAWHDGYWEANEEGLPGVFIEPYEGSLFRRPGIEYLAEAVVAGPSAQVQVAAREEGIALALVYEEKTSLSPEEPWSEDEHTPVTFDDTPSVFIQNPNVYGYARQRGSFNQHIFEPLQRNGVTVREYYRNGQLVAWRFLVILHAA